MAEEVQPPKPLIMLSKSERLELHVASLQLALVSQEIMKLQEEETRLKEVIVQYNEEKAMKTRQFEKERELLGFKISDERGKTAPLTTKFQQARQEILTVNGVHRFFIDQYQLVLGAGDKPVAYATQDVPREKIEELRRLDPDVEDARLHAERSKAARDAREAEAKAEVKKTKKPQPAGKE